MRAEPGSFPSPTSCLAALQRSQETGEAAKKLIHAVIKALSVAESRKDPSAVSAVDALAAALVTSLQRTVSSDLSAILWVF